MRKRVKEIQCCRISGSKNLVSVLNLGVQKLTGVFPSTTTEELTEGPLELVWCPESGLVQMKHSYDLEEMYGMNYGYRSGLNKSMVDHLTQKVQYLLVGLSWVSNWFPAVCARWKECVGLNLHTLSHRHPYLLDL